MREIVHALGGVLRAVERAVDQAIDPPPMLGLVFATHQVEVERQERQSLADVVVQLAGDARAFRVLRPKQAAAEVADPLVADAASPRSRAPAIRPTAALRLRSRAPDDQRELGEKDDGGTVMYEL